MIETIDYNLDAMKLLPISLIILISLIVLGPSFNLALTGDDYLGLYRFQTTISSYNHNLLKYFLTDYGPQDLVTVIIHYFVGFNSKYYYYIAYILRIIAAISFFPLIYNITKNKTASYIAVLFFSIVTTGIETTDWSFNMPSYIGITFMNFCIYYLLKSNFLSSILFFALAIISQPIRLSALTPIILIFVVLYSIFCQPNRRKTFIIKGTLPFLILFITIFKLSDYGGPAGLSQKDGFLSILANFQNSIQINGLKVFLNPIAQIGNIVFPTTYIPQQLETLTGIKFLTISVASFLIFSCIFYVLHKICDYKINCKSLIVFGIGAIWSLLLSFMLSQQFPQVRLTSDILGFFVGGYFLITLSLILLMNWNNKIIKTIVFLSLSIIACSFIAPWLRDPNSIQSTINRYLIVSASGFTIFVSGIYMLSKKNNLVILTIIFITFINMFFTYKYLSHLSVVRETRLTNKIRNSITDYHSSDPQVYYFEADNPEILYHSIMFGFPVIMYYENGMTNIWNVVYTTDWKEVENAYKDGSSLKRFGITKISPVELDNIHSLKLQNGEIEETSEKTRLRLTGQNF